ncbi:MAG: helix-turn-helix domain-containing protein [Lachnospiraceae bacterium]|nr:helix-turn-helix domain-containing protein [Ruminococcus sp.]MCM1276821.1 helix-turn-helix domain-containing protein [Lachnospiraceae bacterium]
MVENSLGQRVRILRQKRGLTQVQLAEKLYISESYIALIEADKRNPSMDIVTKLADYFCVTSDYLVKGGAIDYKDTSAKEWSEIIKGRSDKEIRHALDMVKSFFKFLDNN